jgi:hypothetical protein
MSRALPLLPLWAVMNVSFYCCTAVIHNSFTKFLHCFDLIMLKSGLATVTLEKQCGGGHSKPFVYIFLPLDLGARGRYMKQSAHPETALFVCVFRSVLWAQDFPRVLRGEQMSIYLCWTQLSICMGVLCIQGVQIKSGLYFISFIQYPV